MSNEPEGRTPLSGAWLDDIDAKACQTRPRPDRRAVTGTAVELMVGEIRSQRDELNLLDQFRSRAEVAERESKGLQERLAQSEGSGRNLGRLADDLTDKHRERAEQAERAAKMAQDALAEVKADRVEQDARAERFIAHAKGIARDLGEQIAKTAMVHADLAVQRATNKRLREWVNEVECQRDALLLRAEKAEETSLALSVQVKKLREALRHYDTREYNSATHSDGQIQWVAEQALAATPEPDRET